MTRIITVTLLTAAALAIIATPALAWLSRASASISSVMSRP